LRKNVSWNWNDEQTNAVNIIKNILINKPLLKIYDS
jgi:hypothetical protein